MYQTFFGNKIEVLLRSFPEMDVGRDAGHGRGGPGQRDRLYPSSPGQRRRSLEDILENNMIDRTCEMLT